MKNVFEYFLHDADMVTDGRFAAQFFLDIGRSSQVIP